MATTVPFCEDLELFKGEPNQNAVGWLRRFESERGTDITGKKISPTAWLCEFDSYIADEAATWADKTPAIREMLAEGHIHWATAEDVVKLKRMFRERFQPPETTGTGEAMQPLLNLKQGDTESLGAYYTRTLSLLLEAGGRDDPEVEGPHHRTDTVLPVAIERFISGLRDEMLSLKMEYQCPVTDHSLREVYEKTIEKAKHLEAKSKAEAKTKEENRKHQELESLKDAVRSVVKKGYGQLIAPAVRPILVGMQDLGIVEDDFKSQIPAKAPSARSPPRPHQTASMQTRRPVRYA